MCSFLVLLFIECYITMLNFFKKYSILAHLLLAIIVVCAITVGLLYWLNRYTNHGKVVEVPNVKGLKVEDAIPLLEGKTLQCVIIDSIFVKNAVPGTILETTPPMGASVKEGRIIYITINALNAQKITIPDVIDLSQRQGLSMLRSLGFESIDVKTVPGAYRDLIVGLESRGQMLDAGARVPSNTPLFLLVSSGIEVSSSLGEENVEEETEEESWF